MTDTNSPYRELEARFERHAKLNDAIELLHWDMACMMPDGGADARAGQLAVLKVMAHDMMTDPALGDYLDAAREDKSLDGWQQANLREMRRNWTRANALDGRLVAALSDASARTEMIWREAKAKSDFAMVLPELEKLIDLVREEAAALADALDLERYDGLLDGYEPDGRAEDIDRVFKRLTKFLPGFIDQVIERQAAGPAPQPL